MEQPIYKVHGNARREMKKELRELKISMNKFWYFHGVEKEAALVFNHTPMSDSDAGKAYKKIKTQISEIEAKLKERI